MQREPAKQYYLLTHCDLEDLWRPFPSSSDVVETYKVGSQSFEARLHIVEDPTLIQFLRRAIFVEMAIFDVVGWQQGLSHLFAVTIWQKIMFFLASLVQNTSEGLNLFIFVLRFYLPQHFFVFQPPSSQWIPYLPFLCHNPSSWWSYTLA